ncbi:type IV pilus assembly protein PilM [Candidatus Shapirobacteria bacterium]|nr:type IV pilus assembly protein PilM [Candidatus Shapirobacteria bacterium]
MEFFGLDIGSHQIKMVKLAKSGKQYRLLALGNAPSTQKGILSEAEADLTALATIIKKLHQETKINTKNVVTALPQDQVFVQVISLPKMSTDELLSALKWEAEQYVPIPLNEVTLTHQILGEVQENGKQKTEVLLAAAPNRLIDRMVTVLKTAGFNPLSLETEIMAVVRSLIAPDSEMTMVVDFGAKATDIAVTENGQINFVRSISTAGEALTRAVASGLGLDVNQAEAYKKAYGADPEKLEGKMLQALGPVIEVVVAEMEKIIQFHQLEKNKIIKRVILTGGTASLPEMASLLAKKLNLEIQVGDAFAQIIKDELTKKIPAQDVPLYAIATGLAMKEI